VYAHWPASLGAAQATMTEIADATGGQAFMNSNGLAAAAAQAVSNAIQTVLPPLLLSDHFRSSDTPQDRVLFRSGRFVDRDSHSFAK